jgi:dTDP-4-amino-4,6-dideoxygalactose transaminase
LPAGSTLRELPLDHEDKPNYYCLVLKASRAAGSRIAADLTSCGLSPDTIRWRYQGLHHRAVFSRWACPCPQADALIAATFQIPIHPGLDPAALRCIIKAVQAAASKGNDE